jgi:glycosyltransferase involved in cell wall biosynthesis
MRVLILSQYYDPEPILKPGELAQELRRRGHEVSVVTGFPNYPSGILYPGFNLRLIQHAHVDGVPVTRTFEYPYHGKSALGRMLNYISFMLSAPFGLLKTGPFDVIYVWHPPLTVGIAAWIIARLRRVPFIYDVQDIWPESAILSGVLKKGMLTKLLAHIEKFVYRQAGHILVVTEGARENLITKGVPPDKVSVMPHWINENLFGVVDDAAVLLLRQRMNFNDRFTVLFAGNLGLIQSLDTVVYAADILRQNENILIVFVGDGSDRVRLQNLTISLNLQQRVQFIDRQPMENMPAFMAASDVLLVHLKRSELSRYIIPTKTMAYLAAGKPILMAAEGAAADLINQAEAGIITVPENPSALAEAIRRLAACSDEERLTMGRRGRQYLLSHFSKNVVIPLYESILQKTVRTRENNSD